MVTIYNHGHPYGVYWGADMAVYNHEHPYGVYWDVDVGNFLIFV